MSPLDFLEGGKRQRGQGETLRQLKRRLTEQLRETDEPRHFAFPDRVRWRNKPPDQGRRGNAAH